jgi:hypothetical protein
VRLLIEEESSNELRGSRGRKEREIYESIRK